MDAEGVLVVLGLVVLLLCFVHHPLFYDRVDCLVEEAEVRCFAGDSLVVFYYLAVLVFYLAAAAAPHLVALVADLVVAFAVDVAGLFSFDRF